MSIEERMADADVLWTYDRREGAIFSLLVAATAAARLEHPSEGDGEAFRRFVADWDTRPVPHPGQSSNGELGQLLWKWMRCELAHNATLPEVLQLLPVDDDPDELRIHQSGPPEYRLRLSNGWYWWLRQMLDAWQKGRKSAT